MQQHLRKWMEVVVITHKGGQRSDGSVSINDSDNISKDISFVINIIILKLAHLLCVLNISG